MKCFKYVTCGIYIVNETSISKFINILIRMVIERVSTWEIPWNVTEKLREYPGNSRESREK